MYIYIYIHAHTLHCIACILVLIAYCPVLVAHCLWRMAYGLWPIAGCKLQQPMASRHFPIADRLLPVVVCRLSAGHLFHEIPCRIADYCCIGGSVWIATCPTKRVVDSSSRSQRNPGNGGTTSYIANCAKSFWQW